tara:strand:- start:35028 stop:35207 length:180 start_codon:yes stop_codon:yes gene_type:complete
MGRRKFHHKWGLTSIFYLFKFTKQIIAEIFLQRSGLFLKLKIVGYIIKKTGIKEVLFEI